MFELVLSSCGLAMAAALSVAEYQEGNVYGAVTSAMLGVVFAALLVMGVGAYVN